MVKGLSHITFIVRHLDRMEDILAKVFGARRVYDSGNETFSLSKERFFLVGGELGNRASAHRGDSEVRFGGLRKYALTSSFRGASPGGRPWRAVPGIAREPGIQEHRLEESRAWPVL